ncbi:unnamed protein product [Victoria cruziana]
MKRSGPWNGIEELSSDSDSGSDDGVQMSCSKKRNKDDNPASTKDNSSERKKKAGGISYEALNRHGYKGGFSVLDVPPPSTAANEEEDWSWSDGKNRSANKDVEETYEERERTRAAVAGGEKLLNVQTRKERKNLSFSQKEKRKRELGQASRGKSYVEEEKRLLRDQGVYSGFDS